MTRGRLPPRRGCTTFEFDHKSASGAVLHYTCSFGRFDTGRLAEVFLQNTKAGSDSDSNAREAAIMCSIALQYGAPIDVLRKAALRNANNTASTPLGHALDLIAAEEDKP
jgi:ribonucleoside-diphosphate reductase alpha chain